jgi:multiple sugar transport system permease protein
MVIGKSAKYFHLLLGILVLAITVAYIFPVYWVGATSLKTRVQTFQIPPAWLFQPTAGNYQGVLSEVDVPRSYINSIVIALFSTSISILIGSMAAYGLVRLRIKRREDLSFWILSTRMFPPIASIIPVYMLFRNIGLLDTRLGLVLMYTTFNLGFSVWMMEGFFSEIPIELEQCAYIDGCTRWQVLTRIIYPLARPGLSATAIFCLIFSWNEYLFAVILTGRNSRTMPVIVASAITDRGVQWGELTAVAVLVAVPVMIFASLVQKQMVRGLTFGALKQ